MSAPAAPGAPISAAAAWSFIRRRWQWVAGAAVGTGVAAYAATFLMVPLYGVQTTALPAEEQRSGGGALGALGSQLGAIAGLAGIQMSGGGDRMEALEVLRSRDFMRAFITELGLLTVLFADDWDAEHSRWLTRSGEPRTINEAVERFRKDVCRISDDKRTTLVTIAITWRDRERAAAWANDYLHMANEVLRGRAMARAEHSRKFLEHELTVTSVVEARQAITHMIEVQINTQMLASIGAEYAYKVVDRAVPPDPKDVVSPRRLVLTLIGMLVGAALGAIAAALASRRAEQRAV